VLCLFFHKQTKPLRRPRVENLLQLFSKLKDDFAPSRKGEERGAWFVYALFSIILPFASAKTSNLLRCINTLFGLTHVTSRRFYTFMASPKLPWTNLWRTIRTSIPDLLCDGRLIVALDDCINPKVGQNICACHTFFDHAAKKNQSKYPWAQNIVSVGLLARVKRRWACLPLAFRFYHPIKAIEQKQVRIGKEEVIFQDKLQQATEMLVEIYQDYKAAMLVVADSWFGNYGLWRPIREKLGKNINLLSRLRCNININELPQPSPQKKRGRPRKYGNFLGNTSDLAAKYRNQAQAYTVNLYGRTREVMAYDRVVMLKNLKCRVRVVWIYRKTQWIALFSTDLTLSVAQIIEDYGARWKIEAGFKELKQEVGSAHAQCRTPHAVINHLNFCMMATSVIWIYAMQLEKAPNRHHAVKGREHYAFSDVRRKLSKTIMGEDFQAICSCKPKTSLKSIAAALLGMAA
jgi:hypothetical protein